MSTNKEHTQDEWWYSNETTVEQGDSVRLADGRIGVVQSMWKTSEASYCSSSGRSEGSCDVWYVKVKVESGQLVEEREEDVTPVEAGGF